MLIGAVTMASSAAGSLESSIVSLMAASTHFFEAWPARRLGCAVRGYPLPVCVELESIRRERQDIIGAVDHVSGNAAKFWIGQRLDDDLRSDSGGITHAQSHDGAVVGLGCVAHLHIVSAT